MLFFAQFWTLIKEKQKNKTQNGCRLQAQLLISPSQLDSDKYMQQLMKQPKSYMASQGCMYIYTPQTNIWRKNEWNLLIPSPVSHWESRSKAVTQTPHVVPQPPPTQDPPPPRPGPAMKYKPTEVTVIDLSRKVQSVMHAQKLPAHSPTACSVQRSHAGLCRLCLWLFLNLFDILWWVDPSKWQYLLLSTCVKYGRGLPRRILKQLFIFFFRKLKSEFLSLYCGV